MEFGGQVLGGAQVFVSFEQHVRSVGQLDHAVKSSQLGTHHEVRCSAHAVHHVEEHGGDGRFAMASGDDDAALVAGRTVQVFRVADHVEVQLPGPGELGVVLPGMHAEDDRIQLAVDPFGVPTHGCGQESLRFEPAPAGVVNGVVGTGDGVALMVEGEGEVVHGRAADGDEVNVHGEGVKVSRAAATVQGMGPINAARTTPR